MAEKVGFIGLGAIGRPMAVHVARAFETVVWNRTSARAAAFAAEHGARAVTSVREVVEWGDVVMTCLPTSTEVRAIVERGDAWRRGQLLIDATSGDPIASREIAAWLDKRGAGFVDAPVSGGTNGAEAGTLTVMLGGADRWVERARPFVAPFASRVVHVGPVGAGHAVKAVNQVLLAVNILAAGEGLAALAKLGVSATKALEVINAATGRSAVTEQHIPERVVTRAWPRTFRLSLLEKDVGIAVEMLRHCGGPHDAADTAHRALLEARAALGDDADHVELIKLIEERTGVEIR